MDYRKNVQNDTYNKIMKVGKRIALTIVCTIPFVIVFGFLTRKVITSNFVQILCFMLIFGVAVLIVELVARRREKIKEAKVIVEGKKDVFK